MWTQRGLDYSRSQQKVKTAVLLGIKTISGWLLSVRVWIKAQVLFRGVYIVTTDAFYIAVTCCILLNKMQILLPRTFSPYPSLILTLKNTFKTGGIERGMS